MEGGISIEIKVLGSKTRNGLKLIKNIKKINSDVNIDIREVNDVNYLDRFLKDCFKFKRKNLRNNLNGYEISKISDILNKYGYDLNVRAEDISIDIFIDIVNELCK